MDIEYRILRTPGEKISLYKFRKQVFVDEENRFAVTSDMIFDPHDSFEETLNIGAVLHGEIIAAIRVTMDGPAGLPVDAYYDFSGLKKQLTGKCSSFGWLCCTKAYRHQTMLIKQLVKFAAVETDKRGYQHILAVVHPPVYDLFHSCFGAERIGPQFSADHLEVPMIPVYVAVKEVLRHLADDPTNMLSDPSDMKRRNVFPDRFSFLKRLGFHGKYHYLEDALSRNIGIFTLAEQEKIMESKIAIPGLGGVGGQHLVTLARTGVGKFHIADFDSFEPVNVNRQYGAKTGGFEKAKLEIMYKEAMDINPFLDITCFPDGVSLQNIDAFLEGVDLVADGMDFFNFDIRRLIFSKACEKKIPVITAGPLGFSSALLVFMPESGMTFDRYFDIHDQLSPEEKLIRFFIGLAPKATQASYIDPAAISMSNRKGPSTAAGCQICSSVLTVEAVRILLKKKGIKPAPHYFQYDPYTREFHEGYLRNGNRHLFQKMKYVLVKNRLKRNHPAGIAPQPPRILSTGTSIPEEIIQYIVKAGRQAPSGDNCQPWHFEYRFPVLTVFMDAMADQSFFNVEQTASYIACGAAVENILMAASRYGISGEITYLPDDNHPDAVADIRLSHSDLEEHPLHRFIWERHTNRTCFNKVPLGETEIEQIRKSLDFFPGTRLSLITGKDQIEQAAQLVYEADRIRTERRDLHEHLIKMIRFTDTDSLDKRDGFPLRNLEAGKGGEWFLKACRSWTLMNAANKAGFGKIVSRAAARGIREASAIGLLKVDGKTAKDIIIGGQALERLWLTCTRSGISFQPMTAVTLFRRRWELGRKKDFSMAHQQLLGKIWPLYDFLFETCSNETHIMLFRLGYGKKVSCRTLRKEKDISIL